MSLLKRLREPSSLGGLSMLALVIPTILGKGQNVGGAVSGGIEATGEALATGLPWWQALLVGALAGGAIVKGEEGKK